MTVVPINLSLFRPLFRADATWSELLNEMQPSQNQKDARLFSIVTFDAYREPLLTDLATKRARTLNAM